MTERWLISLRFEDWCQTDDGRTLVGTYDRTWVIEQHPVRYAADLAIEYQRFLECKVDHAINLLSIYWAMPVPEGMLTEEELGLLE